MISGPRPLNVFIRDRTRPIKKYKRKPNRTGFPTEKRRKRKISESDEEDEEKENSGVLIDITTPKNCKVFDNGLNAEVSHNNNKI